MDQVQVQTAQNVALHYEAASIGDRMLAALVDYGLILCYALLIGLVALPRLGDVLPFVATYQTAFSIVLLVLPCTSYHVLAELFFDGQSIGKKVAKIRVVMRDGSQPSVGAYILRWLLRVIEIWLVTPALVIAVILFNGKGQRLGDMLAGTTVVKARQNITLDDTILRTIDTDYTPVFPTAVQLTPSDINTVREVLTALENKQGNRKLHHLATQTRGALEQKMEIETQLPPEQFFRIVLKDYNALHARRHPHPLP